jgi:hypothetical protein
MHMTKLSATNSEATIENLDELLCELRAASVIRNVLCHGSWRTPDAGGCSLPFFVNRKKMVWDTPIDIQYLKQKHRKRSPSWDARLSIQSRTWDGSFQAHTVPEKQYLKNDLSRGPKSIFQNDASGQTLPGRNGSQPSHVRCAAQSGSKFAALLAATP